MDIEELERRINKNAEKLNILTQQIDENLKKINKNKKQIEYNTGALELLHTIKSNSDKYFIMWLITFIVLLISIGFTVIIVI